MIRSCAVDLDSCHSRVMDSKESTAQISKSKAKRLKQKAKTIRIESTLKQEKEQRVSAEFAAKHWKHKASLYKK